MTTNTAAWINRKHGRLVVGPAPYPEPLEGQIVVKAAAVAINPLDWIIQVEGDLTYGWLRYPTVLGADVAGSVVAVGAGVARFAIGDRVVGLCVGTDKDRNSAAAGAFQEYVVLDERLSSPVVEGRRIEEAVTLPLAVSTAAAALFQPRHLGLPLPGAGASHPGGTVLVWGGSTSVGSQAVQLAVAAGYEVVSTASPRNFDHVTRLGATRVFDYRSPTVEAEIRAALAGRRFAGAVAIGTTGGPACVRITGRSSGSRAVAIATPPVSFAGLADGGGLERARVTGRLIGTNIALQVAARTRRVRLAYVWGSSIKNDDIGTYVFTTYLPAALADPEYRPSPRVTIAGHGLEALQSAMDRQRAGVSAEKLVVTL
jgi:NADPH:quinone reductase-like Zn-dependent oxidoreductase